jgi:hypothetical protein
LALNCWRNLAAPLFFSFFLFCQPLLGAQSPSSEPTPADQQSSPVKPADQQPSQAPEEKPNAPEPKNPVVKLEHRAYHRLLGVIPNFIATDDTPENRKPLTPRQKYHLAFSEMFDPGNQIGIGIGAAIDQATEGRHSFGQGWGAYGERFGADEAGNISGTFLTTGLFPHIFKEDPRFFRRGTGGIPRRAWYAFTRVVVTRSDAGNQVFNVSNVFGSLAEDGVSTLFYPGYHHTVTGTFRGWGFQMLQDGGFNILSEFYPDIVDPILRRLHKYPPPQPHSQPDSNPPGH